MIRAKTGKREITPYLWVHPEKETACVQSVRRRVFATKICSCPIRPCRRVALVAWPGPDAWSSLKLTLRWAASSRQEMY